MVVEPICKFCGETCMRVVWFIPQTKEYLYSCEECARENIIPMDTTQKNQAEGCLA
jgi:uncharacterized Zn finger protein